MGRTGAEPPLHDWAAYMRWASKRAGYDLDERGGVSRLERALEISTGQVSRWKDGRVPDLDNLRRLARVWRRSMLEVLVASGHLTPAEGRWEDRPADPAEPERPKSETAERVERLARVMDDPKTSETVRERLRALLDIADDQVEHARERA